MKVVRCLLGCLVTTVVLVSCTVSSPPLESQAGVFIFVSPTGTDSSSCGPQNSPCKTINFAASKANAGDTVQVADGIYYERRIELSKPGLSGQPITIRAANRGKAIIDNGLRVPTWTLDSGSVYRGKPLFTPLSNDDKITNTLRVVVANRPLVKVNSRSGVKEGTFYVASDGTIFLWAFGGVNPASNNPIVINQPPDGPNGTVAPTPGIYINGFSGGASYYVLEGFVHRGGHTAIWAAHWDGQKGNGLILRNCEIAFNFQYALRLDNFDNVRMLGCDVHDNAQVNWPRGSSGWPHAVIGWDSDNVRIATSKIHNNHGEGVGPFSRSGNWAIVDNTVYDNWSVNIYVDSGEDNHIVTRNLVYNTTKYTSSIAQTSDGIRIANEDADCSGTDSTPAISNIRVTNNVVVNTGGGIRFFPYGSAPCGKNVTSLKDSLIANNTVVNSQSNNGLDAGILVARGENVSIINNLVAGGKISVADARGAGFQVKHNLLESQSQLVTIGSGITVTNMRYGNPQFVNGSGTVASNYKVNASSPAVNGGQSLNQVTIDFLRVARPQGNAYDIGAFEQ